MSLRARLLECRPALVAALLVAIVLGPALLPGRVFFHRDLGMLMHPVIAEARQQAGGGVDLLPRWTHASADGRPLLANPGYALLSPGALLWTVLDHDDAFDVFLVLHAVLAAAGMTFLARRLGASPIAAFVAGAGLGLGGGMFSALDLYWALVAFGWAPWVLLAGVAACEAPSPRRLALLALSLALQADGGMPEVVLATLAAGGLLGLAVAPGSLPRRAARVAVAWGVSGIAAIALAAPQLVPAALQARSTVRGLGFTGEGALYNSLDPRAAAGLAWPGWGGSPFDRLAPGLFPGAAWTDAGTPYLVTLYCGAGCLALALAAVVLLRRRGVVVALAGVAALGVIVALGRHVPGVTILVDAVGPLPLRYPVKALFATFLAVPLLAALGLDALLARRPAARALALALAGACALDLALAHRDHAPTIAAAELREPPLAGWMRARAAELDVADAQWRVHHQRFPSREWGPPAGSLPPTEQALHAWQRRMLMPPTGMPHGIRHSYDRLPDQLEDLRHVEAARAIYSLPRPDWARELGDAGVLFVVSPSATLGEESGNMLLRERELGPDDGVPAGSGFVYRSLAFVPRVAFTGAVKGEAAVLAVREDHRGLEIDVRATRESRLVVRDSFGDLRTWRATIGDGIPIVLGREGRHAGVTLPAGEWTVRLDHVPPGWRAAWIASATGLAAVAGAVAWPAKRRLRPS